MHEKKVQKMSLLSNLKRSIKLINFYPPYFFSGISVKEVSQDFRSITAQMKLRWYNRNLFGTHFGGSLYSMCDPFYVFIIIQALGKEYIVWDIGANIQFKKPGRGTVYATFTVEEAQLNAIKEAVHQNGKTVYQFKTQVKDDTGLVIAELTKDIYVRSKKAIKAKA